MFYQQYIIWTEKDKLNQPYFVEYQTETAQHILKMQPISLLLKYVKWVARDAFLHMFACVNAGCLKVKIYESIMSAIFSWFDGRT
jgi:hypothetical protein